MDKHLDTKKCLSAFATILQEGEKSEKGYFLKGIWAESMDDGYTVRLFDNQSELTLYFHNKFQLNSPDSKSTDQFIRKIYQISEQ
ncbi:DUF3081 family protein [uncultured Endozoicomonas sp.]|uniref:DUF3081 family protein n=1 Tax=uncultured Endozoicomonas sp. TaxID=432652 RepID=UPI00261688A9|nr:DUF3081 family protein [uncultured Endozoicomonas sp.]